MKDYQADDIKNLVLLGNSGSGKTTLAESMQFEGGLIKRRGDVNAQSTMSDYKEVEHAQNNSVYSTPLYVENEGKKINYIDCPGLDDYVGHSVTSMQIANTALMLLNTQNGVEVGAEIHWRYLKKYNKATILVCNHLDHEKSNFEKTIEDAKQVFGSKVVLVQYPLNQGTGFDSIIDVLKMKMLKFGAEGKVEELDIPAAEADKAADLQNTLIEAAAENDEELMELFFDKGTLDEDEVRNGITQGLIQKDIIPVFCISAKQNMGVKRLMNFISKVAPSVSEMPIPKDKDGNEIEAKADSSTSLFVFKSSIEHHLGEVLYFKVMSGTIKEGDDLININKKGKERLSQIYLISGKERKKVSQLSAGDLGATVKLKETKTFHTLNSKDVDWEFAPLELPDPKFRTAMRAVNESDDEKLGEALSKISIEDPSIVIEYSKELKQLIVHGQGEYHLNTIKWLINNLYKIEIEFLSPKIPYRETITKTSVASYRHKKQSGGAGQFGEVHLFIEPYEENKPAPTSFNLNGKDQNISIRGTEEIELKWGGKLIFYNCIVGGVIDARFLPAIQKGLMEKMENGPLTGSYARDIRVAVFDGKMHPVDSNEISFKIAGSKAFSDAFKNAGPKIMEPIYDLEVFVPSDKMGDVMSDLQGRRSIIQGMSSEGGYEKISARVPLAEMNKYSTTLSSLTNGRAMFTMKYAEYAAVPHDVQDELLKAYEAEQNED